MPNNDHEQNDREGEQVDDDLRIDLSGLPEWESAEPISANWKRAVALDEAWFDCLDKASWRQYQTLHGDGRRAGMRLDIQIQIVEALFDGRLIALGSQTSESSQLNICRLDASMFRPRLCEIDWQNGTVVSLGRRFLGVHVVKNIVPQSTEVPVLSPDTPAEVTSQRRGRKSLSPLFAHSARRVAQRDTLFLDRSQEKQIAAIQDEAKALAPGQFPGNAKPGRSTVARFVQAQRERGWPNLADPENPEIPN